MGIDFKRLGPDTTIAIPTGSLLVGIGGANMPEKLGPIVEEHAAYFRRYLDTGCCEYPRWVNATTPCPFAVVGAGCVRNNVEAFSREFASWLERGAPLYEETMHGDNRPTDDTASTAAAIEPDADLAGIATQGS